MRTLLVIWFAIGLVLGGCGPDRSRSGTSPDPEVDPDCNCTGEVHGEWVSVSCGETFCAGGSRFECTGPSSAGAIGPCDGTPDAGPSDPPPRVTDAGSPPDVPVDAGTMEEPDPLLSICRRVGPAYDGACDVERSEILIDPSEPRPDERHLFPLVDDFNMNGWEWWQKWPGGHDGALFEAEDATDMGLKCSVASALRYAAIMEDPPAELYTLLEETTWEGRFFNWNDDFSEPGSVGTRGGARLWAWEWYLIKWISQTYEDGTCRLPTRSLLEDAITDCLRTARSSSGVIRGCRAP